MIQIERNTRAKIYSPGHHYKVNESEIDLIKRLASEGIYAEPGRLTQWKYIDVVAWGCVCIETKYANQKITGEFRWRIASRQSAIRGHLIILVCIHENGERTHHIFSAQHPVFYDNDGALKRGLVYKPDRQYDRSRYGLSMTSEIMDEHKDTWYLIEETRLDISNQLFK